MEFSEYSFHDAKILEVKELSGSQTMEFFLDFVDWKNDVTEHRILRFENVTNYVIKEMPFNGNPSILQIEEMGINTIKLGEGRNSMTFVRKRVKLLTNAGDRIIDYSSCDLLEP